MLEASQFDSYGLPVHQADLHQPRSERDGRNMPIAGIRIGVNGAEAHVGQAYVPLDTTIGGANYIAGTGQLLSRVGTVIGLEKGPIDDLFFLSLRADRHAARTPCRSRPVPTPAAPVGQPGRAGRRRAHVRRAQRDAVAASPACRRPTRGVAATYDTVKQQLPTVEKFGAFLARTRPASRSSRSSTARDGRRRRAAHARSSAPRSIRRRTRSRPSARGLAEHREPRPRDRRAACTKGSRHGSRRRSPDRHAMIRDELDALINKLVSGRPALRDGTAHRHESRVRRRARQRRDADPVRSRESVMIIRQEAPAHAGPRRADQAREPQARRSRAATSSPQGFMTGPAVVAGARGARAAASGRASARRDVARPRGAAGPRHCDIAGGRGQDSVHLLRPRGRREPHRLEDPDRRAGRPARLPVDRRATRSSACRAT